MDVPGIHLQFKDNFWDGSDSQVTFKKFFWNVLGNSLGRFRKYSRTILGLFIPSCPVLPCVHLAAGVSHFQGEDCRLQFGNCEIAAEKMTKKIECDSLIPSIRALFEFNWEHSFDSVFVKCRQQLLGKVS